MDELPNEYKMLISAYVAVNQYKADNPNYNHAIDIGAEIPASQVIAASKSIFGSNVSLQLFSTDSCETGGFTYNPTKELFVIVPPACGCALCPFYISEITSVNKCATQLEILEKAVYTELNEDHYDRNSAGDFYYDILSADGSKKIVELVAVENGWAAYTNTVKDQYLDKFDTYKYTFVLENDNWVFSKIERVATE